MKPTGGSEAGAPSLARRLRVLALLAACLSAAVAAHPTSAGAQGHWQSRQGLARPLQEVAYVALGGKLYLAGGFGAPPLDLLSARHERFDPASRSWTAVQPLPAPAHHLQGVAVGGKLYYLGGLFGVPFVPTGAVWEYDPASDSFRARRPMPDSARARGAAGVAALGGRIFVTGGQRDGRATAQFDVYDPRSDRWTVLPDMPRAREHHGAAFIGDRLYVIAGRRGPPGREVVTTDVYDVSEGRWEPGLAPVPTPRGGLGVAALGGKIYAIGGESGAGAHAENEVYDPRTDSWRTLPPMPTARHGIQAAVLAGGIWLAGGATVAGYGPTKAHEAFFPPPSPPRPSAKPRLGRLRIVPRSFRAARRGPAIAARRPGARVRYRLAVAGRGGATVRFRVQRARRRRGRLVGGRCVRRTRRNARRRKCTRYRTLRGKFSHRGHHGVNRFRFTGRLRGRRLRRGRYRLVARARDGAGRRSKLVRRRFRIIRSTAAGRSR